MQRDSDKEVTDHLKISLKKPEEWLNTFSPHLQEHSVLPEGFFPLVGQSSERAVVCEVKSRFFLLSLA